MMLFQLLRLGMLISLVVSTAVLLAMSADALRSEDAFLDYLEALCKEIFHF